MAAPPIVVMSFNRPAYLRQVLGSLAAQQGVGVREREVLLFQDGGLHPQSGQPVAEPADIAACIAAFRAAFPRGEVFCAETNLGVAANFRRAETHVFRERHADCAYFFEDDLVLAPRYLRILDQLRDAAAAQPMIGHFACYGDLRAGAGAQRARAREITRIEHSWGFGLFRAHWERLQPMLALFEELLAGRDYRDRPHEAIFGRLRALGLPLVGSSQDDVKQAIGLSLGCVGINTFAVHARYIGRTGEHMNPALFDQLGYDGTVLLDDIEGGFDLPDAARLALLREVAIAERRARIWSVDPASPQAAPLGTSFTTAEQALLRRVLASGQRRYAEFGAGHSTCLAARSPLETIISVESDPAWAERVRREADVAAAIASRRAAVLHAEIGPVGAWGAPTDPASRHLWPNYLRAMWAEWARRRALPDVVLVDGRFRVASALSVLLAFGAAPESTAPLVLTLDLSAERANERVIFEAYETVERADRLCVLRPRAGQDFAAILARLLERLSEP
jgi:hypothetical protein